MRKDSPLEKDLQAQVAIEEEQDRMLVAIPVVLEDTPAEEEKWPA